MNTDKILQWIITLLFISWIVLTCFYVASYVAERDNESVNYAPTKIYYWDGIQKTYYNTTVHPEGTYHRIEQGNLTYQLQYHNKGKTAVMNGQTHYGYYRNTSSVYCPKDIILETVLKNPSLSEEYTYPEFVCVQYAGAIIEDFEKEGYRCHPVYTQWWDLNKTKITSSHVFVAFEIDENEYVFMDSTGGTVRFFDDVFGFYETVYSPGNVVPFYEIKKYNETVLIQNENW